MPLVVLSAGRDAVLMDTRKMVLESAGFRVTNVTRQTDFINTFLNGDFDAVVLCHTIPLNERRTMASLVKNHSPSTCVFLVSDTVGQRFPFGHTVSNDPRLLVKSVQTAIHQ